jgi:hypothetical protein
MGRPLRPRPDPDGATTFHALNRRNNRADVFIPPPRTVPVELTWLLLITELVLVALPAVMLMPPPADVAPSAPMGIILFAEELPEIPRRRT